MSPVQSDYRYLTDFVKLGLGVEPVNLDMNGLAYFELAVQGYWRALALPHEETLRALGGDLQLRDARMEHHRRAPASLPQPLNTPHSVGIRYLRIDGSSLSLSGAIFCGDTCRVTCTLVYGFVRGASQTAGPVPDELHNVLLQFEQGAPVRNIRTGSWAELGPDASRVRTEVFVQEQCIPVAMEWDDADHTALHAVAYNGLGLAVATGRLLTPTAQSSKVGRMAVNQALRGSQLGSDILQALTSAAKRRGDTEIVLHAQCSAQGFYLRAGFTPRGEPFDEVDIPHVEMVKLL